MNVNKFLLILMIFSISLWSADKKFDYHSMHKEIPHAHLYCDNNINFSQNNNRLGLLFDNSMFCNQFYSTQIFNDDLQQIANNLTHRQFFDGNMYPNNQIVMPIDNINLHADQPHLSTWEIVKLYFENGSMYENLEAEGDHSVDLSNENKFVFSLLNRFQNEKRKKSFYEFKEYTEVELRVSKKGRVWLCFDEKQFYYSHLRKNKDGKRILSFVKKTSFPPKDHDFYYKLTVPFSIKDKEIKEIKSVIEFEIAFYKKHVNKKRSSDRYDINENSAKKRKLYQNSSNINNDQIN